MARRAIRVGEWALVAARVRSIGPRGVGIRLQPVHGDTAAPSHEVIVLDRDWFYLPRLAKDRDRAESFMANAVYEEEADG